MVHNEFVTLMVISLGSVQAATALLVAASFFLLAKRGVAI
jgi:hypothetical protein